MKKNIISTMDGVTDNVGDYVESKFHKMRSFFSVMFRRSRSADSPSPRRSPKMTIIEKGPSKVQTPNEQRPGSSKSETRRESRRENDLISTATSALRRLNFRSAGGSHPQRAPAAAGNQNSPPLQQTGGSTTSETTTNTSTDSSNTVYTLITVTDAEQEDKADHDLLENKALLRDDKLSAKSKESLEPRRDSRDQSRRAEILDDFDELFLQSERRIIAEKTKVKVFKNGVKSNQGTGTVGGNKKGNIDNKKPVTTVTIQDRADRGKPKKVDWPPKKGKQPGFAEDKQTKTAKMRDNFFKASSSEKNSDETFSSMEENQALASGGPPPTPLPGKKFFSKQSSTADEKNIQNFEPIIENGNCEENKNVKMERPKSNIRTIQSELPQRTFSTNFNKRKKVGDLEEKRSSQAELDKMSHKYSPNTSPKPKNMDDTRFPFPPRSHSPISMTRSTSPRLKREMSTSLRKLSDTTSTNNYRSGFPRKAPSHTAVVPLTHSNIEKYEKQVSKEGQKYRSNFGSKFDLNSPTSMGNSPSFEKIFDPNENATGFEYPTCTSPTESNLTFMDDDFEDPYFGNFAADVTEDDEKAMAENQDRMSNKRKKRNDRKSFSLDTSDEESIFAQSRKSRDAFLNSVTERDLDSPQSRKYSVLSTDGTVKNYVSENSEEFKKTGENINKENIKKTPARTTRRSSECPQRHRRVSIIQGESTRTFLFEEPDTSRMKPSKQRKVSQVFEDPIKNLLLEEIHPRKSSLAPGDMKAEDESPRTSSNEPDDIRRKFSMNTLGDIVSERKYSLLPDGEFYVSHVDGKKTQVIKLAPVIKGKPLATIVVQQASIQRGSVSGPSGQREDSLLDVSNTFTMDELHEFNMKYGSPHHSRSQSVKTPGRSCGRPNYLCLPQQRSRVASMPNTGVEEEYYRLRHFSITGKGLVLNRGDSLKSRRSRSNNSVASSNSSHSTDHLATNVCTVGSYPGSARTSAECSLASSRDSSTTSVPYKVVMLGSAGVGKTSLISQFMTSEYLHAYDTSLDEEYGEKSVSVLLDDEESELIFVDHSSADMSPENCITTYQPQAYVIVYAVVDRVSFQIAEEILQSLWRTESIGTKAVILVGNKADLVRCRNVTYEEGVSMAKSYDCKFIETSVGINHNVDELLVGILTQIRLKLQKGKPKRNRSPFGRNTRLSASLKVKGLLERVWAREDTRMTAEEIQQYLTYQEQWFHRKYFVMCGLCCPIFCRIS